MKGMVDRYEGEQAVILAVETNQEWIVQKSDLPAGCEKGTWLSFEEKEEGLSHLQIEFGLTQEKKQSAENLLQSIRSRSKGSKFKR